MKKGLLVRHKRLAVKVMIKAVRVKKKKKHKKTLVLQWTHNGSLHILFKHVLDPIKSLKESFDFGMEWV